MERGVLFLSIVTLNEGEELSSITAPGGTEKHEEKGFVADPAEKVERCDGQGERGAVDSVHLGVDKDDQCVAEEARAHVRSDG